MQHIPYRELRSNAEKIADEHIKDAVLNGIEILNEKYGPDWVDHIDPRTLVLSSSYHCVLGQLYGDEAEANGWSSGYDYGVAELGVSGFKSGFNTDGRFIDLTNAWRTALGLPSLEREPSVLSG